MSHIHRIIDVDHHCHPLSVCFILWTNNEMNYTNVSGTLEIEHYFDYILYDWMNVWHMLSLSTLLTDIVCIMCRGNTHEELITAGFAIALILSHFRTVHIRNDIIKQKCLNS